MNKTLATLSVFMLGTAAIILPVYADNSMAGMSMGGKPMAQKPTVASTTKSLSVTATLNPTAPQTGDNTLDLLVTGPDGKPATGLKLTTSVAMTSMDMGTTHPAFAETGGGHYTAKVSFGMDGPWRVVVRSQNSKVAVLDFNAGSKTPWKSPQIKTTGAVPTQPAAPAANVMPGMDMSGTAAEPADKTDAGMGGMKMGDAKPMKMTGIGDMKTATIPELKETGTYTATGTEDWKMQTGFGHNAPMVGMMNQMMVGGSGSEGMKMAPMSMKFDEKNYAKPEGDEAAGTDDMAGMDMGGKDKGIKRDAPAPASPGPASPSPAAPASAPSAVAATINAPKSGNNALQITVTDAQGKPITGAKITTSVAMTSMDMGTTHPAVKDIGNGKYAATVNFSMAGPWRVNVKVTPPGQNMQIKAFDFDAK